MCDIKLARGTPSRSPRVVDFIKTALPQLSDLKDVDLLEEKSVAEPGLEVDEDKMVVDDLECVDLSKDIDMVSLKTSVARHSLDVDDKRKSAIKLSKTGELICLLEGLLVIAGENCEETKLHWYCYDLPGRSAPKLCIAGSLQ